MNPHTEEIEKVKLQINTTIVGSLPLLGLIFQQQSSLRNNF